VNPALTIAALAERAMSFVPPRDAEAPFLRMESGANQDGGPRRHQ